MASLRIRWIIWSVYALVWTAGLCFPVPETASLVAEEVFSGRKYLFVKLLHVTGYAGLTVLSGWMRVPVRFRPVFVALLMAHATATELVQLAGTSRSGSVADVGYDHLGILLGLAVSWKWWRDGT